MPPTQVTFKTIDFFFPEQKPRIIYIEGEQKSVEVEATEIGVRFLIG